MNHALPEAAIRLSLPPNFRILTVTETQEITPHFKRIHFHGEDIGRYASLEALHVRLFLPPVDLAEPVWPMLDSDGVLIQPPPELRPAIRKYTIRQIDVATGIVSIDFLLHDEAGPGSAFATRARPGDRISMAGPGGRGLQQAERYVFLCDETGLPALARMLENMPQDSQGIAMVEVQDGAEEQVLSRPEGIEIRWIHRSARLPGSPPPLQEAFDRLSWDAEDPATYLWAACENESFRHIRGAARERLREGQDQHLIVSYWRDGFSDEQHVAAKKAARTAEIQKDTSA